MTKTSILFLAIAIASCQPTSKKNGETNTASATIAAHSDKENLLKNSIIKAIDKDDLSITFQKNDGLAIAFHRVHKDSSWSSISFAQWPYKPLSQETGIRLNDYIQGIDLCWNYIEKSGHINITSLGLMSPHNYPDILKNQVYAFNKDLDWMNYLNNNTTQNDLLMRSTTYKRTSETMLKHNVYEPINDFLKQKGFVISAYALEKMASISATKQKNIGIENPSLVPSPLAINISVKKSS